MSLRVGEISFINFIPLAGGSEYPFGCEIFRAAPSELNAACRRGALDASPISFYAYPDIEADYALLPGFCIASDGDVMSVRLFSRFDISELAGRRVYLTPDSESSVGALAAVCRRRFGYDPRDFACPDPAAADAVFLIGDRALSFAGNFPRVYDLGGLWRETFGIPMVFSGIVVRRSVYGEVADALSARYAANLAGFYSDRGRWCAIAAGRVASPAFSAADADEYYRRLTFTISDSAFAECRRILHGKAD